MNTPVSQLKKLVKSRAGRVAELQMEIKILGGIIEKKVAEGDLGGSAGESKPSTPPARPKEPSQVNPIQEEPAPAAEAPAEPEEAAKEEQTKITKKSSNHAFQEID